MNTDNSVTLCMLANCGQSYRGIMLVIITRILFFLGEVWKSCQQRQKNNNFRELIKEMPESDESLNMKIIQGYKRITFIHLY